MLQNKCGNCEFCAHLSLDDGLRGSDHLEWFLARVGVDALLDHLHSAVGFVLEIFDGLTSAPYYQTNLG